MKAAYELKPPDQFPKRCNNCKATYTLETWRALPRVGTHRDEWEAMEMRNCLCGSTLAVVVEVFKNEETDDA